MDSPPAWFFIVLTLVSIVWVLALVPFGMEVMAPSRNMLESRRRLRATGVVGVLTERLVPRFVDHASPRQFWTAIYALTFVGWVVLAVFMSVKSTTKPNLLDLLVSLAKLFGFFWGGPLAIMWFGRALGRANTRRAAQARSNARLRRRRGRAQDARRSGPGSPPASEAGSIEKRVDAGRRWTNWVWMAGMVLLVVLASAAAPGIAAVRDLESFLTAHRPLLLGVTISATALGFVLFMGGILHMILGGGESMSHEEVEDLHGQMMLSQGPLVARGSAYRISGETVGREAHNEWHLRDMKTAWRTGDWRRDPLWRWRFIVSAGAFMALFGGLGSVIVDAPPGIKLFAAVALLYTLVRLVWAFYRA